MKSAVLLAAVVLAARADGEELATSGSKGAGDVTTFAGTFVYAGGEAERAAVKVAVDRATSGMFGVLIAREELMKRSEVRPSYTIRIDPSGTVTVETPGFPAEAAPLDGTEVMFRTKYGDMVKSSQRFVGGALSSKTSISAWSTRGCQGEVLRKVPYA